MSDERSDDHPLDRDEAARAEKHVADEIEAAIDVPASIEEEMLEEAAEIEEIESHIDTAIDEAEDAVEHAIHAESTGRTDAATKREVTEAEAEIDDAEAELAIAEREVHDVAERGTATRDEVERLEEEIAEAEEYVERADDIVEEIAAHLEERARAVAASPLLTEVAAGFADVVLELVEPPAGPAQTVARVPRESLVEFMMAVREAGYRMFVDMCGVDYLRRRPRFEIVANVVSIDPPDRLRVRVPVPGDDPVVPSITPVYPGANFYERETFDMFGIEFEGHPDLTRILMPDDWEGHPLRKDYSVGSVPVQFKGAHKAT